jgi:CubicO group peptidase (beta-lactamase class C family)
MMLAWMRETTQNRPSSLWKRSPVPNSVTVFSSRAQGAILRRFSGEQLDTFPERRVFAPLGMKGTGFHVAPDQRNRIAPRYALDQNLKLILASDQSPFPAVAGTPPGVKPKFLLSIAGLYSTAQDYMRFAQMLANRGTVDVVRMLSPSSVKLMTSNLLPAGGPLHFTQPFVGIEYGMNVGIVLDPSHADFNGGANGDYKFERWQKDKGMRLDHFLLSPNLSVRLVDGGVDRWARGQENASDHAPTWIMLDL